MAFLRHFRTFAVDSSLAGDTNGDRTVDLEDFDYLKGVFGSTQVKADFDNSGSVNLQDFVILKENFSTVSPAAVPEPTAFMLAWISFAMLIVMSKRRR